MKAKTVIATLALIQAAGALAPGAMAAHPAAGNFGVEEFDVTFTEADGTTATQAGSHPFAMDTSLLANRDSEDEPEGTSSSSCPAACSPTPPPTSAARPSTSSKTKGRSTNAR